MCLLSQNALDQVSPGDTILLADGEYWEDLKTQVSGRNQVGARGTLAPKFLERRNAFRKSTPIVRPQAVDAVTRLRFTFVQLSPVPGTTFAHTHYPPSVSVGVRPASEEFTR